MQCHAGFIPTEVVTQATSSYTPIHAMSSPSCRHRGQDATLARFRMCWAPYRSMARSVKRSCQLCKLRDVNFLEQQMGLLLVARLHLYNHVMLDLFGSYMVRGERSKNAPVPKHMVLCSQTWHGGPYTSR